MLYKAVQKLLGKRPIQEKTGAYQDDLVAAISEPVPKKKVTREQKLAIQSLYTKSESS
jgi:hypothetical protein